MLQMDDVLLSSPGSSDISLRDSSASRAAMKRATSDWAPSALPSAQLPCHAWTWMVLPYWTDDRFEKATLIAAGHLPDPGLCETL